MLEIRNKFSPSIYCYCFSHDKLRIFIPYHISCYEAAAYIYLKSLMNWCKKREEGEWWFCCFFFFYLAHFLFVLLFIELCMGFLAIQIRHAEELMLWLIRKCTCYRLIYLLLTEMGCESPWILGIGHDMLFPGVRSGAAAEPARPRRPRMAPLPRQGMLWAPGSHGPTLPGRHPPAPRRRRQQSILPGIGSIILIQQLGLSQN